MHSGWIYIAWGKVDFSYFLFFVYLSSSFTLSFTTFLGLIYFIVSSRGHPHTRETWTSESTFSLCEWPSSDIGCISLPVEFKSCVHMLGQGKLTRRLLPFLDCLILWLCNSVILCLRVHIGFFVYLFIFLIWGRHHGIVLAVKMLHCSLQYYVYTVYTWFLFYTGYLDFSDT